MISIKALAVIVRPADGALLVCEGDDEAGVSYARPVGGSVEFGELVQDAVHREIREELGCDLIAVSLAAVLENRFILNEVAGHEIDFVFRGDLADVSLYDRESIPILDVPGLDAVWWSPETRRSRLVPEGVRELLARKT
jgi:ADP-ribose pyrophosphatase YjhB (NUDIX family)